MLKNNGYLILVVRTHEALNVRMCCLPAGQTASLISKYRPPMPILTLVIPMLKNDGMKWTLVGRGVARQCQIQRGLLPVLAAPSPSGERMDMILTFSGGK